MFLIWFVSLIVALIMKTVSYTIGENHCDTSSCMNADLLYKVIHSKQPVLRCTKRTSCDRQGKNLFVVNQINKIDVHLKEIKIKQKKNDDYQVQVVLNSYNPIKQGNQSLLVKFSFGLKKPCYEFFIPFSIIMDSNDILFPCFSIPTKRPMLFYFYVHYETGELISVQAMNYSLSNVTVGQSLGGSPFTITYDLDHDFIYFFLNATQDFKCLFNCSISVYKSSITLQKHLCSFKQTPMYLWSDTLNLPYHRMNMSRNSLSPDEKFCIYAVFNKSQHCGTLHPEQFVEFAFFQLPPLDVKYYSTNAPQHYCENWNFSYDVKKEKNDIIVTIFLWLPFSACFSSYCIYLYKFDSPVCDPDYGYPRSGECNYEAGSNKTEIMRVYTNVTMGYYCILVVPFLNGIERLTWTRSSSIINVTETGVNNTELNNKDENPEFGIKLVVALSLLLFLIAFILWSCSKCIRRLKARTFKGFSGEKEENENIPVSILPVDKVFLFHSHDDNSIKNDISWLKKFLKDDAKFNVLILSDVLPEIVEKPFGTISDILECGCSGKGSSCASNKKLIIVISEEILCNIDDDHFVWRSLEDKAFHMVLNSITANWREAYCHLFLVAFNESIFEDRRFEKIVPKSIVGAYYTIPNDLINLCMKLGFSSSKEELLMCLERY